MSGHNDKLSSVLGRIAIFKDLSDEERSRIVPYLRHHTMSPGDVLVKQGDEGKELFLIESGKLAAQVQLADGKKLDVAELEEGSFFGEMSIFDGAPRSATCYAKAPSSVLSLREDDFFSLKEDAPEAAYKITRRMFLTTRKRLANTNALLSDLVQWGEEARKRATTDELTGLYNRRYLDEALGISLLRAKKQNTPVSLVMVDLDYFHDINDAYSQHVGDQLICAAADVFRRNLRENDVAARYGGDEFNIIFPDTETETAREICERIRLQTSEITLLKDLGGPVERVTTSQGIATFPQDGEAIEKLREAADDALYAAKEAGRNCVRTAGDRGRNE